MKYPNKLIAEIERRLSEIPTPKVGDSNSTENFYRRDELLRLKKFACSPQQVQPQVDLEKEIDAAWNPRFNLGWDEKSLISVNRAGFEYIARHFYELGLKIRKEE